ncbi:MAG: hypothetical protein EBQ57_07800 [Actinobacteria bacterium]|nr:hypothetical protein [Actinomycetota bacterium]
MPTPSDNASAAAELAALVDAVEACRARLSALAERRNAALRNEHDDADSLLVSIFEAERGLSPRSGCCSERCVAPAEPDNACVAPAEPSSLS